MWHEGGGGLSRHKYSPPWTSTKSYIYVIRIQLDLPAYFFEMLLYCPLEEISYDSTSTVFHLRLNSSGRLLFPSPSPHPLVQLPPYTSWNAARNAGHCPSSRGPDDLTAGLFSAAHASIPEGAILSTSNGYQVQRKPYKRTHTYHGA